MVPRPLAVVLVACLGIAAAPAAAQKADTPSSAAPPRPKIPLPPVEPRPLQVPSIAMDPERPEPIVAWWSNGREILDVREDGSYRLWKGQGRYRPADEVGRWDRQNHATFWLEPYSMRKEDRARAAISIEDGKVVATIRTWAPLVRLADPPAGPEEEFIGVYVGDGGSLELRDDGRYRLVPPRRDGDPVTVAAHDGSWRLENGKIVLAPRSPTVPPVTIDIDRPAPPPKPRGGNATPAEPPPPARLRTADGTLERLRPLSAAPPADGAK